MNGEWRKIPARYKIAVDQDFRCAYCNADVLASPEAFGSSQWDHFVPRSKGGTELVFTCRLCNCLKRDTVFDTMDAAKNEIERRRQDYLKRWRYHELYRQFRQQRGRGQA
jgi:hypothetical protein